MGPPAELLTVGDLRFWLRQYRENYLPIKDAQNFYNIVHYCLLKELPDEVFLIDVIMVDVLHALLRIVHKLSFGVNENWNKE